MSCDCQNTQCLELYVSPCAASVDTGLKADVTGNWVIVFEFNGVWNQQNIHFNNGDDIVLNNQFNGNYKHELKIYRPDGTLFNNTCYTMDIKLTMNGNGGSPVPQVGETVTTNLTFIIKDAPNPTAGDGSYASPYQLQSGTSITVPEVINKVVHEPQTYNTAPEYMIFTKVDGKATTGIFTRSNNNTFLDGDIITISYEA